MKKLLAIALVAATALTIFAQTRPDKMIVTLKDSTVVTYNIADIDSISFVATATDDDTTQAAGAYKVTVPTSFTDSYVKKVLDAQGNQIAEIDYEFFKADTTQKVVIYPMTEAGKADITKGVVLSDGGTVAWGESNACTYTPGNGALSTVWIVDGAIVTAEQTGAVDATVAADVLLDKRGTVETIYKIVKIGSEYWMAENLKATSYVDGTAIPVLTASADDVTAWKANTTGAMHGYADSQDMIGVYGYMYNGYAVVSDKGLAPEGWEIPSLTQWTALRSYSAGAVNLRAVSELWTGGTQKNLTGFSALPCGYYANGTDSGDGTDSYYWSSTSQYDALSKANAIVPARITATGTNMVANSLLLHDYTFGHYVRCIRKK